MNPGDPGQQSTQCSLCVQQLVTINSLQQVLFVNYFMFAYLLWFSIVVTLVKYYLSQLLSVFLEMHVHH